MSKQPMFYNSGILKTTVSRINNLIANMQLVFCLMLQLGKRSTKVLLPGSPINFYGGVSVSYFSIKELIKN
jgi:hypothetical protein